MQKRSFEIESLSDLPLSDGQRKLVLEWFVKRMYMMLHDIGGDLGGMKMGDPLLFLDVPVGREDHDPREGLAFSYVLDLEELDDESDDRLSGRIHLSDDPKDELNGEIVGMEKTRKICGASLRRSESLSY